MNVNCENVSQAFGSYLSLVLSILCASDKIVICIYRSCGRVQLWNKDLARSDGRFTRTAESSYRQSRMANPQERRVVQRVRVGISTETEVEESLVRRTAESSAEWNIRGQPITALFMPRAQVHRYDWEVRRVPNK